MVHSSVLNWKMMRIVTEKIAENFCAIVSLGSCLRRFSFVIYAMLQLMWLLRWCDSLFWQLLLRKNVFQKVRSKLRRAEFLFSSQHWERWSNCRMLFLVYQRYLKVDILSLLLAHVALPQVILEAQSLIYGSRQMPKLKSCWFSIFACCVCVAAGNVDEQNEGFPVKWKFVEQTVYFICT